MSNNPIYAGRYLGATAALTALRGLKRYAYSDPSQSTLQRYGIRFRKFVPYNSKRKRKARIGQLDVGVKNGGPPTMLRLPFGYGLPDRYHTTDQGMYQVLATDAAGLRSIQFYANSVWHVDPATTDTRNYARLAAIYRKYKVVASAIRVTIVNADDAHPVTCCVTPSMDAAIATEELACTNNLARSTIVTQYAGKEIIHHYVNMRKLVGSGHNDEDYAADIGSHPAINVYWHVQLFGDTTTPTALNCHVYVFYSMSVEWTDRESTY